MNNSNYDVSQEFDNRLTENTKALSEEFLLNFYRNALSLTEEEKHGKKVYRVFIGRRSFVTACLYIKHHEEQIDHQIINSVYSDGGLRVLAKNLADELYQAKQNNDISLIIKWMEQSIFLYDDVLIYGRALGSLLAAAEEIFADRYLELSGFEGNPKRLRDIFLRFIKIKTAVKNSQPNLLRVRYWQCLMDEEIKETQPNKWRCFSYDIAERIYHSDIPNAAFIPAICFSGDNYISNYIKDRFIYCGDNGMLKDFQHTTNKYNDRSLDTFIRLLSSGNSIKAFLTVRCTQQYIIPFVFLPVLGRNSFTRLETNIIKRLNTINPELAIIAQKKCEQWKGIPKLNMMYIELLTMILSISLLRSFLDEIGVSVDSFTKDSKEFLVKHTTYNVMMCNYAHDDDVKRLLSVLFDFQSQDFFSVSELVEIIEDSLAYDEVITNDLFAISNNIMIKNKEAKVLNKIERVIFSCGIESEKAVYDLLNGSLSPSNDSIQYFSFPSNNTMNNTLHNIYSHPNSWVSKSASCYTIITILLQMMDAGCFSITVGEEDDQYIQCLKAGEYSLCTITSRFAPFFPILREIENRCLRQKLDPKKYFYGEFIDFLNRYPKCEDLDELDKKILDSYSTFKKQIYYDMVKKLLNSGQHCDDYMFLIEKFFEKYPKKVSVDKYEQYCKYLYHTVMYKG